MFLRRPPDDGKHAARRAEMVETQLRARGIDDERVLTAMSALPRHRFVDEALADEAYEDRPLSIGDGQTISQPYIVALMAQLALAHVRAGARVLDVGTGCGYQAAVLAHVLAQLGGGTVDSLEIVARLADEAAQRLAAIPELPPIDVHLRDGALGFPARAPFDAVVVAAAGTRLPAPLVDQLARGGTLVAPVGPREQQELLVVERSVSGALSSRSVCGVRFVPLVVPDVVN
jgi:protein-L-isoaspartate(D-aspartate) O-methyltransferase